MMSYREAQEMAEFGDVITWSPNRSTDLCHIAMEGSSCPQPDDFRPQPGGRCDEALELERSEFRKATNGLPPGISLDVLSPIVKMTDSQLFRVDEGLSTLFLLDDGSSIIPIFEARQAGQVIPYYDQVEPINSIAKQAQRNKRNQCMAFASKLNRKNAAVESSRKAHLADTVKAQSPPKAKAEKQKVLWDIVLEPVVKKTCVLGQSLA
jgi:hypothetical protein